MRSAVPAPVRRRLMATLPPARADQLRAAVANGGPVARTRRSLSRRAVARQARALLASNPDLGVRHLGSRAWVCQITTDVTPHTAQAKNLDLAAAALEQAGIDYFVIDAHSRHRTTIGINAERRAEVLAALHTTHAGTAVYLGDLTKPSRAVKLAGTPAPVGDVGVRVFSVYLAPNQSLFMGADHACEIEFWTTDETGALVGPRSNRTGTTVPATDHITTVLEVAHRKHPTLTPFAGPHMFDVTFPIDAVYTWVDGADPAWQDRKATAMANHGLGELNEQSANASRYESRDELRYSLRSLETYAPWIRKIYLVTDDQVPSWLDTSNPRIEIISHRDLFGNAGTLPTFNSHAIETRLHHIPGLSEHYLYLNDDVCFGRPIGPEKFFHANGLAKFFVSKAQVDLGIPTPADPPVLSAAKNNRALLERQFGRAPRQKMKHTPHPQRRSVLEAMEAAHPEIFTETAHHQFRHSGDYSIPSSLQHYYSYLTGNAVPGSIRYVYTDLSDPATPARLRRLLTRRDMDVFCINDTDSTPEQIEEQSALLASFFESYFPNPSSFERDRPAAAA